MTDQDIQKSNRNKLTKLYKAYLRKNIPIHVHRTTLNRWRKRACSAHINESSYSEVQEVYANSCKTQCIKNDAVHEYKTTYQCVKRTRIDKQYGKEAEELTASRNSFDDNNGVQIPYSSSDEKFDNVNEKLVTSSSSFNDNNELRISLLNSAEESDNKSEKFSRFQSSCIDNNEVQIPHLSSNEESDNESKMFARFQSSCNDNNEVQIPYSSFDGEFDNVNKKCKTSSSSFNDNNELRIPLLSSAEESDNKSEKFARFQSSCNDNNEVKIPHSSSDEESNNEGEELVRFQGSCNYNNNQYTSESSSDEKSNNEGEEFVKFQSSCNDNNDAHVPRPSSEHVTKNKDIPAKHIESDHNYLRTWIMFPQSRASVWEVFNMVLALGLRFNWSDEAITATLDVFKKVGGPDFENLDISKYTISQLFSAPNGVIRYVFYCKFCNIALHEPISKKDLRIKKDVVCRKCLKQSVLNTSCNNWFLTIDLEYQIKSLLINADVRSKIYDNIDRIKKKRNNKNMDIIDIYDGDRYYCKFIESKEALDKIVLTLNVIIQ